MISNQDDKKGFTIVEVVIAGLILAIVATGLFAASVTAFRTQMMATTHYRATSLARNRIQRCASLPFDTIPLYAEFPHLINENGVNDADGRYQRTTLVNELTTNYYEVVVQILYQSRPGNWVSNPVELRTKIARNMYDGATM